MPKPYFKDSYIDEMIRVNHAGEYGAKRIYEGQLKFTKTKQDRDLIISMLEQEKIHLNYFKNELHKRNIRPTLLMPLWDIGGYFLGSLSAIIGKKTSMLVTEKVEEVIEAHYQKQLDYLSEVPEETDLKDNIKKFQDDEIEHKNIAIEHDSMNANCYFLFGNLIKNICKGAIFLSKKL